MTWNPMISRRRLLATGGAALAGASLARASLARAQGASNLTIAVYAGVTTGFFRDVVAKPFTAESGIPTEIFESAFPAASIAQSRGHPQFDLALVAHYSIPGLSMRGQLEELTPDDIPAIRKIPERFWLRSPSGKLTGMPIYFGTYGIAFNSDIVKAADFQSWNDLTDPKWKGKVSMSRASFVAAYDLTLFAKLNGGDSSNIEPGIPMVRRLAQNVLSVYTSMSSLQSQLSRGEVVASPFYHTQVSILKRNGVKNVDFTIPREGGMNLPYSLVIPKGAPNLAGAKRLLNAIVEARYQLEFAKGSLSFPTNPAVVLPDEVKAELGGTTDEMLARNYSPDWWVIGSQLPERTRMIDELLQAAAR